MQRARTCTPSVAHAPKICSATPVRQEVSCSEPDDSVAGMSVPCLSISTGWEHRGISAELSDSECAWKYQAAKPAYNVGEYYTSVSAVQPILKGSCRLPRHFHSHSYYTLRSVAKYNMIEKAVKRSRLIRCADTYVPFRIQVNPVCQRVS